MNLEFHYYATAALALRAGYQPSVAHTIARSSEEVDQALVSYEILDFRLEGQSDYRTEKTQDYNFWDEEVSREIYLPFHFIPGEADKASALRLDGALDPWIVTPDSPLARSILVAALRSGDPYRIGIALHAYADTWAHQNFTGRLSETNALGSSSPLPPAGHLQALMSPDLPLEVWNDPRLRESEIDNRGRFLAAARMIFRFLRTSLKRPFDDEGSVLDELGELWGRRSREEAERQLDFVIAYDIEPWNPRLWRVEAGVSSPQGGEDRPRGYDKLRWLRAELERRSGRSEGRREVDSGGRFRTSALRAWSEAATAHRREALALIDAALDGSKGGPGRTPAR